MAIQWDQVPKGARLRFRDESLNTGYINSYGQFVTLRSFTNILCVECVYVDKFRSFTRYRFDLAIYPGAMVRLRPDVNSPLAGQVVTVVERVEIPRVLVETTLSGQVTRVSDCEPNRAITHWKIIRGDVTDDTVHEGNLLPIELKIGDPVSQNERRGLVHDDGAEPGTVMVVWEGCNSLTVCNVEELTMVAPAPKAADEADAPVAVPPETRPSETIDWRQVPENARLRIAATKEFVTRVPGVEAVEVEFDDKHRASMQPSAFDLAIYVGAKLRVRPDHPRGELSGRAVQVKSHHLDGRWETLTGALFQEEDLWPIGLQIGDQVAFRIDGESTKTTGTIRYHLPEEEYPYRVPVPELGLVKLKDTSALLLERPSVKPATEARSSEAETSEVSVLSKINWSKVPNLARLRFRESETQKIEMYGRFVSYWGVEKGMIKVSVTNTGFLVSPHAVDLALYPGVKVSVRQQGKVLEGTITEGSVDDQNVGSFTIHVGGGSFICNINENHFRPMKTGERDAAVIVAKSEPATVKVDAVGVPEETPIHIPTRKELEGKLADLEKPDFADLLNEEEKPAPAAVPLVPMPAWAQQLASSVKNRSAHMFVLDGNIFDQVLYGLKTFTLREFLKELMPEHDYVLRYNTVEGATGEKGDKAEMGKWLGFDQDGLNREQLVKLLSDGGQMNNPDRLFEKLSRALLKKDKRLVMIFDFAEFIFSGNELYSLQARVWALKEEFRKNGHVIIMLTHVNDDIDRRIHNNQLGVRFLTIPKPNTETRTTYLRSLEPESLRGEDARTVALLTSGLGLRQIDALLRSVEDQNLLEHIKKDKFELVAQEYGQLFRAVPCGTGLDVIGGSEKVKKQLRAVARWLKEGKLAKLPMGIMFDGPPGTGKTFTAINWAGELDGFSMIMPLDIRDSFVGQSEKNMTRMIRGARDLAPCVVFWDEADQEGSRGGRQADGGTDSRVFRRRLEWMGDTADRGQIIHVIATNRSDLLDAAMARTGRSDLRLAFLEPNQAERELLIKTICVNHTKNYGIQYEELEVEELARLADGRSQADLDKILRMADEIADENGRSAVTQSDVAAAIYNFRTNTKYQDEKDLATLQAIDGVSDRRMLPDGWQDQVTRIYKRLEDIQIPRVREFATRLYREVQKEESELQVATETGDGRGNGHANDTKTDEVYIEGRHLEL